jgi:hypothetical protein
MPQVSVAVRGCAPVEELELDEQLRHPERDSISPLKVLYSYPKYRGCSIAALARANGMAHA